MLLTYKYGSEEEGGLPCVEPMEHGISGVRLCFHRHLCKSLAALCSHGKGQKTALPTYLT